MAPKLHYVSDVHQLRDVVANAQPDGKLLIAVSEDMGFGEVKRLWEVVTLEVNDYELANVEALIFKHQAGVFLHDKIVELEGWRDRVSGQIGTMQGWVKQVTEELGAGGLKIAPDYAPILLRGPMLFLDIEKVGKVDGELNRQNIVTKFKFAGPTSSRVDCSYWNRPNSIKRQLNETRSLRKLNVEYLKIKIDVMSALRDRITEGIRSLRQTWEEPTFIGGGDTGGCLDVSRNFFRIEMLEVKRARDGPVEKGPHKRARGDRGAAGTGMDMD